MKDELTKDQMELMLERFKNFIVSASYALIKLRSKERSQEYRG